MRLLAYFLPARARCCFRIIRPGFDSGPELWGRCERRTRAFSVALSRPLRCLQTTLRSATGFPPAFPPRLPEHLDLLIRMPSGEQPMDKIEYSGALCFTEVHDVSKIAVQFSHFATSVSVGGVSLDVHSYQRSPTQPRQRVEHRRPLLLRHWLSYHESFRR